MGRFYSDLRAGSALSSQHFAGVPSWFWLHLVQEISNGIRQSLRSKRSQILTIAARHGARKVRVFGSVVHGAARRNSDIDVLVDMEESRRLLDHAALVFDLERLLKRPVDVASERGLRRLVRREVLKEAVAL